MALLLSGCASVPTEEPAAKPMPPEALDGLMLVWEAEVSDSLAMLTAIRPAISGPPGSMSLYDSATQGLSSLAGEPTVAAVKKYEQTAAKNDPKVLERIRAEKLALEQKTNQLEADVKAERDARLVAEGRAKAAEEAKDAEARRANKADTISVMVKVGAAAMAAGIAAFFFGHLVGISKLTAGLVVGSGMAIAAGAPLIVDMVELKWVILGLAGFLVLDVLVVVALKTWRYIKPPSDA